MDRRRPGGLLLWGGEEAAEPQRRFVQSVESVLSCGVYWKNLACEGERGHVTGLPSATNQVLAFILQTALWKIWALVAMGNRTRRPSVSKGQDNCDLEGQKMY